jgi:hypothetical protein
MFTIPLLRVGFILDVTIIFMSFATVYTIYVIHSFVYI